jgi:hypothetical protein
MARKNGKAPHANRTRTRAVIASFAGRFGLLEDVLAMWVALMSTELRIRPERMIEALDILDTMPPLGSGAKPTLLRESILHLAKRLGLNAESLQAMMDRPYPPEQSIGDAPMLCTCGQCMVKCEVEVAAPFWACPTCHPDAVKAHVREA